MVRWPWSQSSEGHGEEVVVSMAAGKPSTEDHHIEKDVLAAGRAACYKVFNAQLSLSRSLSLLLSTARFTSTLCSLSRDFFRLL